MTAKTLMVMGTHSNAGKSILVTALCRIFAREGYRVAPYKAQNRALNAGVTPEGHEIGRATIAQAEAAGVSPHVDMNPVLLKPEGHGRSQVVLSGRPHGHSEAKNWYSSKAFLWKHAAAGLDRLRERFDLVIIEGAGSPAEINLKDGDIVNMRVAQYAQSPVLLVGDIDRGGVHAVLDPGSIAAVPGLTLLGAVLAYAALRTGDLSLPIALHSGVNLLAAIALLYGQQIGEWAERQLEELEAVIPSCRSRSAQRGASPRADDRVDMVQGGGSDPWTAHRPTSRSPSSARQSCLL